MRISKPPLHIFLSYSRENGAFVQRLHADLDRRGIPIWLDTQNVIPGTANWERFLRDALEASFVVVLVATPDSRDSSYVQTEISVAKDLQIPVVPIWTEGETWIRSAPLGVAQTQYIDVREPRYEMGIEELSRRVQEIIAARKPRHTLVTNAFAGWYDHAASSLGDGISSYITIQLDDPPYIKPREACLRDERAVLIDPDAYDSMQALLDELYAEYLRESFPPLTYGSRWILEERDTSVTGIHPKRLAVPWDWIHSDGPISQYRPYWGRSPLDEHGLMPGGVWAIRDPETPGRYGTSCRSDAFVLALNTDELLTEVLNGPGKQPFPPVRAGFLEVVPIDTIVPSEYRHLIVALDGWVSRPFAKRALRETEKAFNLSAASEVRFL
jgi:hypothetical protein